MLASNIDTGSGAVLLGYILLPQSQSSLAVKKQGSVNVQYRAARRLVLISRIQFRLIDVTAL